jgi:hypothetical protein
MKRTRRRKSDTTAGKGRTRISTTITEDTDAELRRLAGASSLTRTAMARECITDAVARGLTVTPHRSHAGKVIEYPRTHPGNPTARAADDAAS